MTVIGRSPDDALSATRRDSTRFKTILLVKPPFYRLHHLDASLNRLPLSLGYLAAMISRERSDWNPKILNTDFSPVDRNLNIEYLTGPGFENYRDSLESLNHELWVQISKQIEKVQPNIVALTVTSQTYRAALNVARVAKGIDRNITTIFGGPHVTIVGKDVLTDDVVDIGVSGESEYTILELLDHFDGKMDLSRVKGIVYREGTRQVSTKPRELCESLDSFPFPVSVARESLIDFELYPKQSFKYILASRGCPYGCVFCASRNTWSQRVRNRSPTNVVEELAEIQKLGVEYVHFIDDTWGVDRDFSMELCQLILRECSGLKWSCETHVKLVKPELIVAMKNAGCRMIQIGVESGNNRILKRIKKGITIEEAFRAAKMIKGLGLYVQTFFMVGFPDETESSIQDTISAMFRIPSDEIIYSTYTPSIGVPDFDYCRELGVVNDDFDASFITHQAPNNHYCPGIDRSYFEKILRKLEKDLDRLNSRKKLKRFISSEGLMRAKEKGLARSFERFSAFARQAIRLK